MAFRPAGAIGQILQASDGKAVSVGLSGEKRNCIRRCRGGLQAGLWLASVGIFMRLMAVGSESKMERKIIHVLGTETLCEMI